MQFRARVGKTGMYDESPKPREATDFYAANVAAETSARAKFSSK
jgi:hypothetical protein